MAVMRVTQWTHRAGRPCGWSQLDYFLLEKKPKKDLGEGLVPPKQRLVLGDSDRANDSMSSELWASEVIPGQKSAYGK